jgi:transposase
MQGRKHITPKMFYQVHLDELVPQENFYRRLDGAMDLQFVKDRTARYYGSEGQDSIDPVVFFKICLVGYLNNVGSDRRLMSYCSNCLDVRLYLKYDIDEPLPWHSTISRTRQLYGEEVFLELFKKVLSLCISAGMVRGKRQAIDSALVKANASLDSLEQKQILDDVERYSAELNEESEFKIKAASITPQDKSGTTVSTGKNKSVEQHHEWKKQAYKDMPGGSGHKDGDEDGDRVGPRFLSNHTHYSPTDPDARIAVKPGKPRQMNYYAQVAVDESHHVITGAGSDFADKRDSECLAHILGQTISNLKENDIVLEQITADAGYSSGTALEYCRDKNIDAFIPNFGQYKNSREGFIYNQTRDQYECMRGNKAILPFKKIRYSFDKHAMKVYRSDNSKCKSCPLRSSCIGKGDYKKIEHSIHKPLYDAMHEKLQTPNAKKLMKKRSSTVEPVLGTLLNFVNLRRCNTRGIEQANKHVMMAALTYNLKKYLKFTSRKVNIKAQAMTTELINTLDKAFSGLFLNYQAVKCTILKYRLKIDC